MCGISAIASKDDLKIDPSVITAMTDMVQHRGPDASGYFFDEGLAIGHRRLSIIDLDERSNQPMKGPDGLVISYNGELYNYMELRSQLEVHGYEFQTSSDTEVVLMAYHYWGADCLPLFNGMWAFIIYDPQNRQLFASRDRFGIKPLYYARLGHTVSFASEIKQFTVLPQWRAQANHSMVVDYFYYSMTDHTEATLFKDVFSLPGGHSLVLDLNSHEWTIDSWYRVTDHIRPFVGTRDEAMTRYHDLLLDAVSLRLRADVKVGSSLSGGLDSSSIVAMIHLLLQSVSGQPANQEVVTACYQDERYDERQFSRVVAKALGIQSHEVYPDVRSMFDELDRMVFAFDEPFGSLSGFSSWSVFKRARQENLVVMLDGQGPDELLGGYLTSFYPLLAQEFSHCNYRQWWRDIHAAHDVHGLSKFRLMSVSIMQALMPDRFKSMIQRARLQTKYSWISDQYIRDHFQDRQLSLIFSDNLSSFLQHLFVTSSIPKILRTLDRESMAASVESRVPFLDHRLVEHSLSLPSRLCIDQGVTKRILRDVMTSYLPEVVTQRMDKMGYVTPEDQWFKTHHNRVRSLILDGLPSIFNRGQVDQFLVTMQDGFDRTDHRVWQLLNFCRWADLYHVQFD